MAKDSDFLTNLTDFLYPRHKYRGQFKPEYLVFNSNLQEFSLPREFNLLLEQAYGNLPLGNYTRWRKVRVPSRVAAGDLRDLDFPDAWVGGAGEGERQRRRVGGDVAHVDVNCWATLVIITVVDVAMALVLITTGISFEQMDIVCYKNTKQIKNSLNHAKMSRV